MHMFNRRGRPSAARKPSAEPARFRMRSRNWEFFVADEVEAFAVLARHDIDHIEVIGPE